MADSPISTPSKGPRNASQPHRAANTPNGQNNTRNGQPRPAKTQQRQRAQDLQESVRGMLTDSLATPPRPVNSKQLLNGQSHYLTTPARHPQQPKFHENGSRNYASDQGSSAALNDTTNFNASAQHCAPSTPNKSIMASPAKQAYAGPTFHASPAPSSLPVPRFYSRSLPLNTAPSALRDMVGDDSDAGDGSPSKAAKGEDPIPREESPLDFFFKAHRAEQAKAKVQSPLNTCAPLHFLSPSMSERQIHGDGYSREMSQERSLPHHTPSGKHMFMMEMDDAHKGYQEEEVQPVTPFRQKMNDALGMKSPIAPAKTLTEEEDRMAKTQALKKLLMLQPSSGPLSERVEQDVRLSLARQGHGMTAQSSLISPSEPKLLQAKQGNSQPKAADLPAKLTQAPSTKQINPQALNSAATTVKPIFQPTSDMAFFSSGSMRPRPEQPKSTPRQTAFPLAQAQPENLRLMENSLRRVLKLER